MHSLIAERGWGGAGLRTLVERELAVYVSTHQEAWDGCRITVLLDGPPVALMAKVVRPMAMLLHELATYAAKHGAMSVPNR